jgi:integrase
MTKNDKLLFPHRNGQWAKKVKGRIEYFGKDYDRALIEFAARFPDHPQLQGDKPKRGRPKVEKKAATPKPEKPEKPTDDFPLYAHNNGQWAASVSGEARYFGTWDEPYKALALYRETLRQVGLGQDRFTVATVGSMVHEFLKVQRDLTNQGKMSILTLNGYTEHIGRVEAHFGGGQKLSQISESMMADFRAWLSDGVAATTLSGRMRPILKMLRWATKKRMIDEAVWHHERFKLPSAKQLRDAKAVKVKHMPLAIGQELIRKADPMMKVAFLFAANAAYEPHDCGLVTWAAIRKDGGVTWLDFPRPKTGCPRKVPLWPETVSAIEAWKLVRPEPAHRDYVDLILLTRNGTPVAGFARSSSVIGGKDRSSAVGRNTDRMLRAMGEKIDGVNFMGFRHVFQTEAEAIDQIGAKAIMGHIPPRNDMASEYRVAVKPASLFAVANAMRTYWILGKPTVAEPTFAWGDRA